MKRTVSFGGAPIAVYIVRRQTDRARLRVSGDGAVRVTVPMRGYGVSKVDAFIRENRAWIEAQRSSILTAAPVERILGRGWPVRVEPATRLSVRIEDDTIVVRSARADDLNAVRGQLDTWLRFEARKYFESMIEALYPAVKRLGAPRPAVSVRAMRSRWGSCNARSAHITLNLALYRTPVALVEYVVLHELAHLIHPNHQAGFRDFMTTHMPDWRARRALLQRESVL